MGAQQGGSDAIKQMQLAAAGRSRRADAIGRKEGNSNTGLGGAFGGSIPELASNSTFFGGAQEGQASNTLGGNINKPSFAEFLAKLAQNQRGNK